MEEDAPPKKRISLISLEEEEDKGSDDEDAAAYTRVGGGWIQIDSSASTKSPRKSEVQEVVPSPKPLVEAKEETAATAQATPSPDRARGGGGGGASFATLVVSVKQVKVAAMIAGAADEHRPEKVGVLMWIADASHACVRACGAYRPCMPMPDACYRQYRRVSAYRGRIFVPTVP